MKKMLLATSLICGGLVLASLTTMFALGKRKEKY